MGAVELIRFRREILVGLELFRRDIQILRRIGEDIEKHFVRRSWRQFDALVINSTVDRRIDQLVQRGAFEPDRRAIDRRVSSAVAYFQPAGNFSVGSKSMS